MDKLIKYNIIVFIVILLFGCDKRELEDLKKENTNLKQNKVAYINSTNEIVGDLNTIYDSLVSIQNSIVLYQSGIESKSVKVKDVILNKISNLKEQLGTNKIRLTELENKLSKSESQIVNLSVLVKKYQKIVESQENQIKELNAVITGLKSTIQTQQTQIAQQQTVIEQKEKKSNALFYIVGEETNLIDEGFLVKKGVWPLRTINLSDNPDQTKLTKIDLRTKKDIIVNLAADEDFGNVNIYPDRDKSSYTLLKVSENSFMITIANPELFLNISKFLIITCD